MMFNSAETIPTPNLCIGLRSPAASGGSRAARSEDSPAHKFGAGHWSAKQLISHLMI